MDALPKARQNPSNFVKLIPESIALNEVLFFPSDPASAVIVATVRASDPVVKIEKGKVNLVLHVIAAVLMHFFSISVQLLLVFLIFAFPIEQSEDPFENDLQSKTQALLDCLGKTPPQRLNTSIPAEKGALEMCMHDHTVIFSQSLLIFLWALKVLPSLTRSAWSVFVCFKLPRASHGQPLVYEKENKALVITHLPKKLVLLFISFVQIPEVVVTLLIMWVGAKFLIFSSTLMTLIMKSMGLFFLTQVDEVIYEGLASHPFKDLVRRSCFSWYSTSTNVQWNLWGASATKLVIVVCTVLFYTRIYHGDVQEFRGLCMNYKQLFPKTCPHCGLTLFNMTLWPA